MKTNCRIMNYDVWGNARDGYAVNNVFSYGSFEFDGKISDNKDVLRFLNKVYFRKPQKAKSITIDDNCVDTLYINSAKDGMPICEIVFEKDFAEVEI